MGVREEFEKVFQAERVNPDGPGSGREWALWGAKFMAERIAQEAHGETARNIRQLAKELQ